jgi:hypothetical protein
MTLPAPPGTSPCGGGGGTNGSVLPAGWQTVGDATVSPGDRPGAFCVHSDSLYWGGISNPTVPGCDYTFSADGRVLTDHSGWGLAVRTSIAADGTLTGHAVQYQTDADSKTAGYRDTDYPSDYGTLYAAATDTGWHHLSETVRGDYYMIIVDGRQLASGSLSYWDQFNGTQAQAHHQSQACGGLFIRTWSGGTVELKNLKVTRD